ncbi:hydantoinase B/oxoprolinase family protein [Siccirubricoccus sp. KC 17139]|uniref:Hydantoinase B/oxoprolinase family protein n=1 Tax=Siccirubricoccus soli TaxID=2899147 RepID=A0ABT1D8X6_9PROT|nr:hydantoinase B/oxoprolinase family protein [Siccirubricoccus soli]MCO6418388.1 hydantoinase B/oxoprolinase family protein [Siccirubricoccus soli]MCP2684523.1 hydantoinase B/oxoprolinase family protein [Siccirubricoccus soli]
MELDPVEYAILSQSVIAAAREMGAKLIRSAYSTILREARDGSAALLDAEGFTVAQAELIPMQLGSIGPIFQPCKALFPKETLEEGDFLVINDPYSGGQHLQDVFFFHPIFVEGEVIGFAASVAHHLDLGGGAPGLNAGARDVYAEGLIIPPMKVNIHRDWHGGGFQRLLRANVRVPQQTMGDFDAQIAANNIGVLRMQELAARYGVAKLRATMAALQDYSERRMRAAIAEVPDGTYRGEAQMDDDGLGSGPVTVRVAVIVAGDSIDVDFAGTDPQVGTNLNCPFASVISASVSCLKAALTSPDIPFNDGALRPIKVTAPKGSLLNPSHPAPVRARMVSASRAWESVMLAISQAVPEKVIAQGYDTTTAFCLSWLGPKGWSVYLEVYGGGYGAGIGNDGCDAVDNPLSNCSNTPVEAMDQDFSFFRVLDYVLRPDSAGVGARRGGAGFSRSYEILVDGPLVSHYSDRFTGRASGLFGGGPGASGACQVKRGGQVIELRSKDSFNLLAGDIVTISLGGGGGYGKPADRPAALIQRDLEDGIITPGRAAAWAAE